MKDKMRYNGIIRLISVVSVILISSCSATKETGSVPEDELIITRRYVGNFLDYRHTSPDRVADPHIVWIKTTQDSVYGKFSVLSKECRFEPGERLFLKRKYVSPGMWGYWEYQIENDRNVSYRLSEFQHDKQVLIQSWF